MNPSAVGEFPASSVALGRVMAFIAETSRELGLDAGTAHAVRLAVEEVFTNICAHGHRDTEPGPVEVEVMTSPEGVVVTVSDRAAVFDPSTAPTPDLDADWQDRPLGGLGWHLVRQVMDEVEHRARPGGGNVVTLVKRRSADESEE